MVKVSELMIRETLPKKEFFNCSEVCNLLKVKPHELRYWESEFSQIRAQKTKSGKRIYNKDGVVTLSAIKYLLNEKKYTLEGAKLALLESDVIFGNLQAVRPAEAEIDKSGRESMTQETKDILQSAADMLDHNSDAFDEVAHEIYQNCGEEISTMASEQPHDLGEMISDGIAMNKQKNSESRHTKLEYEKALATLIASRDSLTELLASLEQYGERKFCPSEEDK